MKKSLVVLGSALVMFGCVEQPETVSSNRPDVSFDEFKRSVYQEPTGVYIVNGDTPIETEEELYDFYLLFQDDGALIVNTTSAGDDCWSPTERMAITYCVSQSSFGSNYTRVVNAMEQATGAWEAEADVDFIHDASKDGDCNQRTKGVVFDVRQVSSGQYLARAFFPSTSRRNRNVLIDTSTYSYDDNPSDPLSLAGVLRHELGHTLGFRHEHTRPESGTCFEDNNWRELTSYDSDSVMHYPQCNGTGDWSLTLTQKDKTGVADLYGVNGSGGSCSNTGDGGGDGGGAQCIASGDSCKRSRDCCSGSCGGWGRNKTCD